MAGDSTQSVTAGADIGKRAVENNYLSVKEAAEKAKIQEQLKNPNLPQKEREKLENRLAEINRNDIEKDKTLETTCSNAPLSSACQSLMKEVKKYEFGYFGTSSQSGNYYGMPVYTRNNQLYADDANKVAAYSNQYDLLRLRKEASLEEFAKYTGWDINTVRSIYAAADTAQAIAAVYAGMMMNIPAIQANTHKSDISNLGRNNPKFNQMTNELISYRKYSVKSIQDIKIGMLPGEALDPKTNLSIKDKLGVPRNMPASNNPDAVALDFAEKFLGRKITQSEWDAGKNLFKRNGSGKDCIGCFKVDLGGR